GPTARAADLNAADNSRAWRSCSTVAASWSATAALDAGRHRTAVMTNTNDVQMTNGMTINRMDVLRTCAMEAVFERWRGAAWGERAGAPATDITSRPGSARDQASDPCPRGRLSPAKQVEMSSRDDRPAGPPG